MSDTEDFSNAPLTIGLLKAKKENSAPVNPRDVLLNLLRKVDNKELDLNQIVVIIETVERDVHILTNKISSPHLKGLLNSILDLIEIQESIENGN